MRTDKQYSARYGKDMWAFFIVIDGERYGRRYEYDTKKEAEDAMADARRLARDVREGRAAPPPSVTLGELQKAAADEPSLQRRGLLRVFGWFVALLAEDFELTAIKKKHWNDFIKYLRDERGCSNGTINRYLSFVHVALCKASVLFEELDDWAPPLPLWVKEPEGRKRIFTPDELARILTACLAPRRVLEHFEGVRNRRDVYDLICLMLLTGAREGEILSLTRERISWSERTVSITSIKGRDTKVFIRDVPLSTLALEIAASRRGPQLFTITTRSLYETLEIIGEMAGVPYGRNVENGWVLYDIRHQAATVMANAGVPFTTISEIIGHRRAAKIFNLGEQKSMTNRYTHALADAKREAVEALADYLKFAGQILATENQKTMLKVVNG
jgi:integrase